MGNLVNYVAKAQNTQTPTNTKQKHRNQIKRRQTQNKQWYRDKMDVARELNQKAKTQTEASHEENDDNIFVRTALMRISRLCCGDDNERRFFKKCSIPGARCGGWLVGGKKVGKKFVWD